MSPQPFTIAVPDEVIADLHRRLDHARWPDQAPGEPWSLGIPVAEVRAAVAAGIRRLTDWAAGFRLAGRDGADPLAPFPPGIPFRAARVIGDNLAAALGDPAWTVRMQGDQLVLQVRGAN